MKTIKLSPDRERIVVTAELVKETESYLVAHTQFWVVRPRIAGGQVSGLGTLFSGSYIGMDIGKSATEQREFVGLEVAPIVTADVPGRHFLLHAESLGSLQIGSPVYFRQEEVGTVVSLGLTQACASSPPMHFYTLSTEASGSPLPIQAGNDSRIVVGPVSIPDVVDRPQIVVRSGPNQVILIDDHRWAEPLKSDVTRVMAENISRLVGSGRVWAYPEHAGSSLDYRVLVAIQIFESTPGRDVVIDALWTVQPLSRAGTESKTGRSRVEEPLTGTGYEAIAAAHSRALGVVSREIADMIHSFGSAP